MKNETYFQNSTTIISSLLVFVMVLLLPLIAVTQTSLKNFTFYAEEINKDYISSTNNGYSVEQKFLIDNETKFFDIDGTYVDVRNTNGDINEEALKKFIEPGRYVSFEQVFKDGKRISSQVIKRKFTKETN